ncbi:MAG: TRAP transporter small permease subunit [Epsilonproteobacteria bacterium]|nr:TRAP transporter small permease subunit [Campylobacterota bacterium]
MEKIEKILGKFIDGVGYLTMIVLILMIFNVAYDVFARYIFHNSSVAMQEMEWHLFAVMMLFGTGYTLRHNGHVRVDFIYDNLSPKKRAWINIIGTFIFLLPLALLVIYGSIEFVMDSYVTNEKSGDPGGLPYRWIIKGMIPLSFIFLILCAIDFVLENILILRGEVKDLEEEEEVI